MQWSPTFLVPYRYRRVAWPDDEVEETNYNQRAKSGDAQGCLAFHLW